MTTTRAANPTLHHVNLKTTRVTEMIEWYGLVIGLETTHLSEHGAWLSNDEANHRIALLTSPAFEDDADKLTHAGLHHTAYEYPSVDDLLTNYARLKEHGILPHACLDHGMTMSFYYVDPDGNSVELQCDWFGDWARSKDWMTSSADFAANPIGVNLDPEQVVAARDAGTTVEQLHRRAYSGEFSPDSAIDLRLPSEVPPHTA